MRSGSGVREGTRAWCARLVRRDEDPPRPVFVRSLRGSAVRARIAASILPRGALRCAISDPVNHYREGPRTAKRELPTPSVEQRRRHGGVTAESSLDPVERALHVAPPMTPHE